MSEKPCCAVRMATLRQTKDPTERGLAMITLLVTVMIVTLISLSLIGFMTTDMSHASIQYAVTRSFYIAQAGLEEAKVQLFAAADPTTYATPAEGVTESYGNGRFTYRVGSDADTECGAGLTTLEAVGQVAYRNRTLSTRVRACGVAGAPFLTALFGVGRVRLQGAATRLYLAPYLTGTPGGGGSLGSFTEINFSDQDVRVNALNDVFSETLTLRDGRFLDYMLFGFPTPPRYDPTPMADQPPWILSAFGDIIKAQPASGLASNACGTQYACLTVRNGITDINRMSDLRGANYVPHVYMNSIREVTLPRVGLASSVFRARAAQNSANAAMNKKLGFARRDSVYAPQQFYQIVAYLAADPSVSLSGTVFVDGSFLFSQSVNLGNVTLAVGGDLVVDKNASVAIRHDLTAVSGRRIPGIVVFGAALPSALPTNECEERLNRSGRFVLCHGSTLIVDGLVYTTDGMVVQSRASVDQVGAMYHDNRGTANPSFSAEDATVVLRFDPLALTVFGHGIAILSWHEVRAGDVDARPLVPSSAAAPSPSTPATAAPRAALGPVPPAGAASPAPEPVPASPATRSLPAASLPPPAPPATEASLLAYNPPRPDRGFGSSRTPVASSAIPTRAASRPAPTPAVPPGLPKFHVQAGAFKNRAYADDLIQRLRADGYTVTLTTGPLMRVWVGPPMGLEAARQFAARLRANGFEALLSPAR